MSCVVGIVYQGIVFLGGDSARTTDSFQAAVCPDPKVWRVGEMVIGCVGNPRICQLLHHGFIPSLIEDDLDRYMTLDFIDALRECLKDEEKPSPDAPTAFAGNSLLVGIRGRLFAVHGSFQIEEFLCGYNAIGCADDIAYGALYATRGILLNHPQERLCIALEASQEHNAAVRAPFVYVSTEGDSDE